MSAPRLLIVNPNTDARITGWLAEEARRVAGGRFEVEAINADSGLAALETPEHVRLVGEAVLRALRERRPDAALIAAFGDPGLAEARALGLPVAGLGEAGLRAAGAGGRRFGVVTLGAAMREPIRAKAEGLNLVALRVLPGRIADYVAQRESRRDEVAREVEACVEAGAEAVLLGGAPFAGEAALIVSAVCLIDGVESAVEELWRVG